MARKYKLEHVIISFFYLRFNSPQPKPSSVFPSGSLTRQMRGAGCQRGGPARLLSAGGFGALDCNWEAGGRLHAAVCLDRDSFQLSSRAGVGETGRSQTTSGGVHPCVEVVVFSVRLRRSSLGPLETKDCRGMIRPTLYFSFFSFFFTIPCGFAVWLTNTGCFCVHLYYWQSVAPLVAQWGSVEAHNARPGRLGQGIFAGQRDKGVLYSLFF